MTLFNIVAVFTLIGCTVTAGIATLFFDTSFGMNLLCLLGGAVQGIGFTFILDLWNQRFKKIDFNNSALHGFFSFLGFSVYILISLVSVWCSGALTYFILSNLMH